MWRSALQLDLPLHPWWVDLDVKTPCQADDPVGELSVKRSADVLIAGAGVAGLSAAARLREAGLDVIVLEGRDRVGGRIWTIFNEYCHPIELGAEFIHGKQKGFFDILKETRLRMFDVSNHHRVVVNGKLTSSQEYFRKLEDVFSLMMETAKEQDMTFAEFARHFNENHPHMNDVMTMAYSYVEDFNAADAELASIQWLNKAGEAEEKNDSRAMFRLVGGYSTLVEALRAKLHDESILLNHVVKTIDWGGDVVQIEADHNESIVQFVGKAMIVTLPLAVLQCGPSSNSYVEFSPPLPEGKTCPGQLIMGKALRLTFQFRSRFWEELSLNGKDNLNNLAFIHEPELDFQTWWTQLPVRVPILIGWFAGGQAEKLIGKPIEKLREVALTSLATILQTSRERIEAEFEHVYYHDWNNDPFTLGAYSYAASGSSEAAQTLAKPIDAKLFFAGEATNTEGEAGTVHGALQTGLRAAEEVISTLSVRT